MTDERQRGDRQRALEIARTPDLWGNDEDEQEDGEVRRRGLGTGELGALVGIWVMAAASEP